MDVGVLVAVVVAVAVLVDDGVGLGVSVGVVVSVGIVVCVGVAVAGASATVSQALATRSSVMRIASPSARLIFHIGIDRLSMSRGIIPQDYYGLTAG